MRATTLAAAAALLLAAAPDALAQGQIIIVNVDGPGEGFNDPTPAAPVGGNPGTTLGGQRLNVFNRAADLWEAELKPRVDVFVTAAFNPLGANVLGSAGTTFIFSDFPGAELAGTWYHSALADHLAGEDLNPGFADINTQFSSNFQFYLGFDNEEGVLVDLLPVVLHELGHGLGFANFVNEASGALALGLPDIYSQYTYDVTTGKIWNEMSDAERAASALNVRKVSWSGISVTAAVPKVLEPGEPFVGVQTPAGLGPFMLGTASFGAPLAAAGVTGDVVIGSDGVAGGTPTDGCEPITADVAGKIALVDRGLCGFVVKVRNAQDAGAIAVIVADNLPGSPPAGLGGVDPAIVITSGRVTLADGNALKAAIAAGPVNVTLGLDQTILAGTDRVEGLMMVASLDPVALGSSISHYEAVASPNQLMEPAINTDLGSTVRPPADLTLPLLTDIGWFSDQDGVPDGVDQCLRSDTRPTVFVNRCNSRVTNDVLASGCTVGDLIALCGEKGDHHYSRCISHTTNDLRDAGVITQRERNAIKDCK